MPMASGTGQHIPALAGILNLTADSFSDGGMYPDVRSAVAAAEQMAADGAALIDIGAESTRPGAKAVSAETQLDALLPVLHCLAGKFAVSIDTRSSVVAEAVLSAGAVMINDVSGLRADPALAETAAKYGAKLVLTHSRGTPETMQNPAFLDYTDLVAEVNEFFAEQIAFAVGAGMKRNDLILDPGIGFAKTAEQNFELLRRADAFRVHGLPLYYGVSRKNFLAPGRPAAERDFATAGALAYLTLKGIDYLRVHHVAAARDAVRTAAQLMR